MSKKLESKSSSGFEQIKAEQARTIQRAKWLAENREAIVAYNELVRLHGTFGERLRSF